MPIQDLITDAGTGLLSHTKLWANVAYATATVVVLWLAWRGALGADLLLIYLGVVGASATASKFLSLKYGREPEKSPEKSLESPLS